MTNKTQLLPCPFCGGKAVERMWFPEGVGTGRVGCSTIEAKNNLENCPLEDAEIPVAKWNTRAPAEDVRAVVDEPVLVTAVAVTRQDEEEGLVLEWLLEGGISELEFAGTVLFAMPEANDLCDEDGSAELYRHPQRPMVLPGRRKVLIGVLPIAEDWEACVDRINELNK